MSMGRCVKQDGNLKNNFMTKKINTEVEATEKLSSFIASEQTELEHLHALWAELKALSINSISDLEVKIARLQK